MAASTTLMTFMVRTPFHTRSVSLYGSWDNFSTPYPMKRDVRLGVEHWSGCHSFENIICDGQVEGPRASRNGGLKMGGTYWYYYKLDDEIEFHNSAEPATSRCPMLPGQLVNELHVPFALSGSRKRNASISSTSSERRTLNPHAKFMNPRPVPASSKMIRLNTSPTVIGEVNRPSCLGSSSAAPLMQTDREDEFRVASSRIFHIPRKPSLDGLLRSASMKQNPAGLRQTFKSSEPMPSTSQEAKYQDIINWIPDRQINIRDQEPEDLVTNNFQAREDPPKPPRGALLLRNNSDERVPLSSFSEHRRQKSESRSRSRSRSARSSIVFEEAAHLELNGKRGVEQGALSALIEVTTPEVTPGYGPATGRRITLEALEGRRDDYLDRPESYLSTEPDTPSSTYLSASTVAESPPLRSAAGINNLDSRFSATTIDTSCHVNSMIMGEEEHTRFLELTESTCWSPTSDVTIEDSICSTVETEREASSSLRPLSSNPTILHEIMDESDYLRPPRILSSAVSCTTISSSVSSTPTVSYEDGEIVHTNRFSDVTSIRSSAASFGNYQHYSLPAVESASEVTLKRYDSKDFALVDDDTLETSDEIPCRESGLSHSEGMQQLLNELSYLSEMIQQ